MIMKNRLSEEAFGGKQPPSRSSTGRRMMGSANAYFSSIEETIAEHPGLSVAAAVLAGLLLAWWIKRR
jgi:hypothetical protein